VRNGFHTEKEYFKEQIEAARSQTLEVNRLLSQECDTSEKVKAELADLSQRYHLSQQTTEALTSQVDTEKKQLEAERLKVQVRNRVLRLFCLFYLQTRRMHVCSSSGHRLTAFCDTLVFWRQQDMRDELTRVSGDLAITRASLNTGEARSAETKAQEDSLRNEIGLLERNATKANEVSRSS
jgi:hypothetical protein